MTFETMTKQKTGWKAVCDKPSCDWSSLTHMRVENAEIQGDKHKHRCYVTKVKDDEE